MKSLFTTLDAHPGIYWLVGLLPLVLFGGWILSAWQKPPGPLCRRGSDRLVELFMFVLLAAWRWPLLLDIYPVTPAEAQWLAGALTLAHQPFSVCTVEQLNQGPLTTLALLPTHWLGIPQDYFNARLVALLLDAATLILAHRFLRKSFSPAASALGLLPLLVWFGTTTLPAVAGYSTLHLFLLLSALTGWLLWRGSSSTKTFMEIATGISLGLLTWASANSGVMALTLWMMAAWPALSDRERPWPQRLYPLLRSGAIALYLVALVLAFLHGTGHLAEFWTSYQSNTLAAIHTVEFWSAPAIVVILRLLWLRWMQPRPIILSRTATLSLAVGFSLLAGGLLAVRLYHGVPAVFEHFAGYWKQPHGELAQRINKIKRPRDTLAVWGERPHLHVETGLPSAARASRTLDQLTGLDGEVFSQPLFLADLRRSEPVFFVDAVGPGAAGNQDRAQNGHAAFGELADYVVQHYRLNNDDGQARLYLRADRVAEMNRLRPGVVSLTLAGMSTKKSLAEVTETTPGIFGAHAPALLAYPIPAGAKLIRGSFGFFNGAYANPKLATDGAEFVVEVIGIDGQRQRLLERRLTPASIAADRGPIDFVLALPDHPVATVEFIIEAGDTPNFDWTYWGNLQFESEAGSQP